MMQRQGWGLTIASQYLLTDCSMLQFPLPPLNSPTMVLVTLLVVLHLKLFPV
jgi:hypothetical protein